MTPLPKKGDVVEAMAVLNERISAAYDGDPRDTGPVREGTDPKRWKAAFGDLFDFDEVQHLAANYAAQMIPDLIAGAPLMATYSTTFAQGVAAGVMAERRRWEADR